MVQITVYNDLEDRIIAKFWAPDSLELFDKIAAYWREKGLWIGIFYSSHKLN